MTPVFAGNVEIPLDDIRMPSDDLVFEGRVLKTEEAYSLKNSLSNPIDLSKLDPFESEVWKNQEIGTYIKTIDNLPVKDGDKFDFMGAKISPSGLLRFNSLPVGNANNQIYTMAVEKKIHTMLLRKNLLRKLGYQVPPMKYLKNIVMNFSSKSEKLQFVKRLIPERTYGAPKRWLGHKQIENIDAALEKSLKELVASGVYKEDEISKGSEWKEDKIVDNAVMSTEIEVRDLIVMRPHETDHYNTAINVPPKRLKSRTLRSLIIPYSILEIGESINKVDWSVGKETNNSISLPHFTIADFDVTLDDALWSLRRLAKLDKNDFAEVVNASHFPPVVAELILEKIVSRRNSLMSLFKLDVKDLEFDIKISSGEHLKKGRLLKEDWDNHAERFAHGDPESPFKDFQYFLFSKLQTSVIEGLIQKANAKLQAYDIGEAKMDFHKKQFEDGLADFIETGEFKDFPVATWFSPVVNGSLILNRDIVIGNHLGTDNMVQLADTFGFSVTLGGHLGIENLPYSVSGFARGTVSALKTWSHLKPVKSLKATFKEPYLNMIVPLVKMKLKNKLETLSELQNGDNEEFEANKNGMMAEILEHINKNLGVGESLIMTEKLTPSVLVQGKYNIMGTSFGLGAGADAILVRRIHLYRKDAETVQVYDDRGRGKSFSVSLSIDNLIPIIRLQGKSTKGHYKVKVHTVNINTDVTENPDIYANAQALHHLLEEGSGELLEAQRKPFIIENDYHDKSTKFSFLVWRAKYLKGDSLFTITTPRERRTNYVSVFNQSQSGINYQAFVKDVANYYIGKYYGEYGVQLGVQRWKNPAHTIKGVSETRFGRYDARLIGDHAEIDKKDISHPFMNIGTKKEGWSASHKKMTKIIKEINDKYGKVIFNENALGAATKLRLFDVSVNLNIYYDGLQALKGLSEKTLKSIQRRYKRERAFSRLCKKSIMGRRINRPSTQVRCGNLSVLIRQNNRCKDEHSKNRSRVGEGKCLLELAQKLEKNLEFKDFKKIIGEKNLYIYGVINGFRKDSEILNDPITGNTIGEVGDRFFQGPLDAVKNLIGVQSGEFDGKWIRESL